MVDFTENLDFTMRIICACVVCSIVLFLESKRIGRKQAKCHHKDLEKISESATYDMQLNPTSTVKLKCLECGKIFEVKK
nr:MAG TPA: zinc-ribbon domain protein [Caudoviricetes sp.]